MHIDGDGFTDKNSQCNSYEFINSTAFYGKKCAISVEGVYTSVVERTIVAL